ncbi:MAG: hypothetical protein KME08_15705 [Aphanothece sp. CMT-3BRIN-NPC111]|jgi:hypothetical protein|nr:hypothetical protein [Aphanothece sp. CMT-3BRIN-NPC111]
MKLKLLAMGLLSCSTLLGVGYSLTNSASAQCVMADVSVQYNISGSRQPTDRSNDVDMQSQGSCSGNAIVTTGVQGNEGGRGQVVQHREVRQRVEGNGGTSVDGSTVKVISNVGIDVYNPADNLNY